MKRKQKRTFLDRVTVAMLWVSGIWIALVFLTVGTKFVSFLLSGRNLWDISFAQLGTLGDFFAGTFGTLAFAWLVLGYYLQRQELALQREQMRGLKEANEDLVLAALLPYQPKIVTIKSSEWFEIEDRKNVPGIKFSLGISMSASQIDMFPSNAEWKFLNCEATKIGALGADKVSSIMVYEFTIYHAEWHLPGVSVHTRLNVVYPWLIYSDLNGNLIGRQLTVVSAGAEQGIEVGELVSKDIWIPIREEYLDFRWHKFDKHKTRRSSN